jgi:predicted GNAT family acetyltransferase
MGEAYRVVPFGRMRLNRYATVDAFLTDARAFLVAREAEHNLILGLCTGLREHPELFEEAPFLATVTDADGAVVLASIRTPPWNLVLSETDDPAAVDPLADALAGEPLPGVLGPREAAARFAQRWSAAAGRQMEIEMRERIFRLTRAIPPRRVSGSFRLAEPRDRETLAAWIRAFHDEATPTQPLTDVDAAVDRWIDRVGRSMYIWEDGGRPVSLAGAGGETPSGVRIGPVYTPPEFRRRGYASALTAAVSRAQLDSGRRFVFLFTDLANRTSNRIYQAIGYEPVTDVDSYRVVEADAAR